MKALLVLGGVFLALGVSLGLPAMSDYAEQRAAWRAVSENVELGGYDAALSDALYQASEETRMDAEWAGVGFAAGWLLLLAGWTPREEGPVPISPWKVTLVDGLLAWSALLLAGGAEALGGWDTHESALAAAIAGAAPVMFFLPYAGFVAGRSPGLTLVGAGLPRSWPVRLRALLLAPLSLPVLALTFWVNGRFSWLKAIHLPRMGQLTKTSAPKSI